jgi:ectoine hydroxylase-related dioxygenase (phytanoyl-CoA dioxygenase family)
MESHSNSDENAWSHTRTTVVDQGVLGAVELHMEAGDVLLFVDCLTHGAAVRTNPGVRRTVWHRYTMAWSRLRWGYTPSTELCDRLINSERSAR